MSTDSPQSLVMALFAAGDTQQVIADKTGISQATISRIADGTHTDPRSSTVDRIRAYAAERLKKSA